MKNYVGRDVLKIELAKLQYPEEKIRIIYETSEEWQTIVEKYSKLIDLWETATRNLRTHPELYITQ
jgi:type I restriction-modification system DNA methylase subunit